ncbi:MAG TPA: hypothetical protein VHB21_12965 [Minicystis sp.]|nr:hypothetical protein [Minicystis sp.]
MREGPCPKCASPEAFVLAKASLQHATGALVLDVYICARCGGVELAASPPTLPKIAERVAGAPKLLARKIVGPDSG